MSDSPVSDWQLKLDWAEAHFNTLNKSVRKYNDSDSYGFEISDPRPISEPNTFESDLLLKINNQPPIDHWRLMIGDIVHNYRSALDVLIYQHANNPGSSTAFPIFVRESAFQNYQSKTLKGLSAEYFTLIEREQPYYKWKDSPSSDPLAILAELDNANKHRVIPAAFAWLRIRTFKVNYRDCEPIITIEGIKQSIDGTPVARFRTKVTGPNPSINLEHYKTGHVIFDKGVKRASEKDVFETLIAIRERVRKLVKDFERESATA